ncbi:E3 ubiquitin-protein ligase rnf146 isoform X1 [Bactrocera neohumeralis]|uniref:E3 ubiquitin-protein ligase rnf146 isoform X1 n=1 Tax=Bactrocera neohumeralis TaxID=98809 RepID=UPI0021663A20|nr:E3 ubiquitin-protein ligase rnf146 isoform X1 [Bactrocera neohumeralis]
MEQSEELNGSLDHGSNVIASVPRVMAMRDDANAAVIVPFEVEPNSQLPTTSVAATSSVSITTTTMGENATAADAVIDLCNTSPTPSTSKTAATAAASIINVDSSPEEQSPNDEDVAGPSAAIECPICLQTCIHPARLPCGHIFCFLCVKGVAYKNRRCAMCRREIPPEFLDHPDLVNGIDDICATKSTEDGYQWFYEGRNGWWQYDDRTSQDIEEAFKKGEKSCIILVAGYVYVVDLETMVQQRQNEPSRCRRVKRDLATIPKKGVAGLRIEGNTVITDSNFASQIYQQQQQQSIAVGLGASNTPTDSSSDLSLPLNYYSMRHPANASDFISTIAATDAAIRIASDIIGSTLAHADELSRNTAAAANTASAQQQQQHTDDVNIVQRMSGENTGTYSGSYATTGNGTAGTSTSSSLTSGGSVAAAALVAHGSRELLDAAEDLLDATQNVISEADQQTIDLFEQTLNDFHALTLRNIIDSDSDEENGGDVDGRYAQRHIRF